MPLTDPIREPLTEVESLIPGLASQLPGIQTNKTLLYQTPGSSENSEQPNLIATAKPPKSEFSRAETDAFITNKASDINSIPSANTSEPRTNSNPRDAANSEIDPLIGKLDSDSADPHQPESNNLTRYNYINNERKSFRQNTITRNR